MANQSISVPIGSDTAVLSLGIVACSNGKIYINQPTTDARAYLAMLDRARNELYNLINNATLHPTKTNNRVIGLD